MSEANEREPDTAFWSLVDLAIDLGATDLQLGRAARGAYARRTSPTTAQEVPAVSERMALGVARGLVLQARKIKAGDEAFAEQLREAAWVISQLAARTPDTEATP